MNVAMYRETPYGSSLLEDDFTFHPRFMRAPNGYVYPLDTHQDIHSRHHGMFHDVTGMGVGPSVDDVRYAFVLCFSLLVSVSPLCQVGLEPGDMTMCVHSNTR